jgi:hypothetical protein
MFHWFTTRELMGWEKREIHLQEAHMRELASLMDKIYETESQVYLAPYWPHVRYILSICRPIGHT